MKPTRKYPLTLHVNGETYELEVKPQRTLLEVLRNELELTGTNEGCATGDCGACTVLLDGLPVTACLVLALDAHGRQVTTVEGLATAEELHPLQRAFVERGAIQCGYCTPGLIISAYALLQENPRPDEAAVRLAIAGNLCRCTGYTKVVEAVLAAAEAMYAGRSAPATSTQMADM